MLGPTNGNSASTKYAVRISQGGIVAGYMSIGTGGLSGTPQWYTATQWSETNRVTGLAINSSYSIDVKAMNDISVETDYCSPASALTPDKPTVSTIATPLSIDNIQAVLRGNVSNNGRQSVTSRGISYKDSPGVVYEDNTAASGSGTGIFNMTIGSVVPLMPNTHYYYRAWATNSVGTSMGSEESFWTNANTPGVPVLTKTGFSTMTLTLLLNGNPSYTNYSIMDAATGYYVDVSGVLTTSTTPIWQPQATWGNTVTISGLTPGTGYSFIVYAMNGAGIITAGVSSNTLRTDPPPPVPLSPVNNTTGIFLGTSSSINLIWSQVVGTADSWDVELSPYDDFRAGNTFTQKGLTVQNATIIGLAGDLKYYWRVKAYFGTTPSDWSAINNFTTESGAGANLVIIDAPAIGSICVSTLPKFDWQDLVTASGYKLEWSTDPKFLTGVVQKDLTGSANSEYTVLSADGTLLSGITYYWRVQSTGSSNPWTTSVFTTTPGTPTLISPANAAIVSVNPLLKWDPVPGAASYALNINSAGFIDVGKVTAYQLSGLTNNTTYTWTLGVKGGTSCYGGSATRTFNTVVGTPVFIAPANTSTLAGLSSTLSWGSVTGATKYHIQVSTDPNFGSIYDEQSTTSLTYSFSSTSYNTLYYWRVQAGSGTSGSEVYGDFSDLWSFTTGITSPVMVSPLNGSFVSTSPVLRWNVVPGATSYSIEYHEGALTGAETVTGITGTSYPLSGLINGKTYNWSVRAVNSGGISAWANSPGGWSFTTTTDIPVLLSPASGTPLTSLSENLQWIDVAGAARYNIQVSTSPLFLSSDIVVNEVISSGLSYNFSSTSYGTKYYWRVRSGNGPASSTAWGEFSEVWNFTTLIGSVKLNEPLNDKIVTTTPTLTWDILPGASTYNVQVYDNASFTPPAKAGATGLTANSWVVNTTLTPGIRYYWRVEGRDANNYSGGWSTTINPYFRTSFDIPVLSSPSNFALNISLTPILTWSNTNAQSYTLQYSKDPAFGSYTEAANIGTNSYTISTNLDKSSVYHWRVKAVYSTGESEYSGSFSFTTLMDVVTLLDPVDNKKVSTTPTLTWNPVIGATSYDVEVFNNSEYNGTAVASATGLKASSWVVNVTLGNGVQYYWRARGINTGATGPWSAHLHPNFTTSSDIPSLLSPSNYAINQLLSPTLAWSNTGALSYDLLYGTDPLFTSNTTTQNVTTTSYALSGLSNSTIYYWKVKANYSAGSSDYSGSYSFTTIMNDVTLIDPVINKNVSTTPTLSWNTVIGAATYDVEVHRNAGFTDSPVAGMTGLTSGSWVVNTTLSNGTKYYWRARGNNSGVTGNWSYHTDPSFTTNSNIPVLISPGNYAINVPTSTILTFSNTGATTYNLQYGTDPTFTINTITQPMTGTALTRIGLLPSTVYYWRVQAVYPTGPSEYSAGYSFTTVMSAVILADPIINKKVTTTPTLSWNSLIGATSYDIEVYDNAEFNGTPVTGTTSYTSTSYIITSPLTNGAKYYWRVRGRNSGATGSWSSATTPEPSFTTSSDIPTLLLPANFSINIPLSTTLTWSNTGAVSYTLQYSADPAFSTNTQITGITSTNQLISDLVKSKVYYWRVCAVYATNTSEWSSTNSFTTLLDVVTLVDPVNNKNVSTAPTLTWNPLMGAATYDVEVFNNPEFTGTAITGKTGLNTASWVVSPALANGAKYYWRVMARDALGNSGGWSAHTDPSFTTSSDIPALLTPGNYSINIPLSTTLSWSNTGAASYILEYSSDPTFSTGTQLSGITTTEQIITGLNRSKVYYWRVQAVYPTDTSAWSSGYSFTTILDAVTLVDPVNNKLVSVSPTLTWSPLVGAESYNVEVFNNASFTGTAVTGTTGLTTTSWVVSPALANGNKYYWRVIGNNSGGAGLWSAHSDPSFTTSADIPSLQSPANYAINISLNPTLTWSKYRRNKLYTAVWHRSIICNEYTTNRNNRHKQRNKRLAKE